MILAIGSQNAFVLRQGIKGEHVFWVCLVCALSDALLIASGVAGFGSIVKAYPDVLVVARYVGSAFLIGYGGVSLYSAFAKDHILKASELGAQTPFKAIAICLAFTWLNPHVYLDTVVLLGSISTQYIEPLMFGLGAISASFVFFFSLGFAAKKLAPLFERPLSWKLLDGLVGAIMFYIALSLLHE
ncbi:L-lysine exporter, putative [Oceanobacter sp. RED65]|uniref:L-lysine exporter, putative n=1 Tax=Bermanella marisrubri TaxID=207949 RepID=Q1MZT8_9GAMM|nr:L-lysine exporter, putative [Oceanobacter sp. RED65] [Bermanella marisrubri]